MRQFDEFGYGLKSLMESADPVLARLCDLEGQTWSQIFADRKKHHPIAVEELSPEARHMLAKTHNDIPGIFSLSLSSRQRLFGTILEKIGVIDVFWWDPEHRMCISHLKHT